MYIDMEGGDTYIWRGGHRTNIEGGTLDTVHIWRGGHRTYMEGGDTVHIWSWFPNKK